jgi:large subunit ribosomal protein L18e
MKTRDKNPILKELIEDLCRKDKPLMKTLAKRLNKPRRQRYEVNLYKLEKFADPKETVVVPGIVLGSGNVTKAFRVAALKFSGDARKKIEKAGGKCIDMEDFVREPAKKVRIMG